MQENLKGILLSIVADLEEKGIDLEETPALFNWRYPDDMEINYQLLIKKGWDDDEEIIPTGSTSVH